MIDGLIIGGSSISTICRQKYQTSKTYSIDFDRTSKPGKRTIEVMKLLQHGRVMFSDCRVFARKKNIDIYNTISSMPPELAVYDDYDENGKRFIDCLNRERIKPILERLGVEK